jgi:hypothetical protein
MDALKKNKFLSAFLISVGVGVLVLGWLLYSSLRAHNAAAAEYESTKSSVQALRSRPVFPDDANFRTRQTQVNEYAGQVSELQNKLLGFQKPLNAEMKSAEFQGKLKDTIESLKSQAEVTKLGAQGAEFDLGMTRYRSDNPREQAVAELDFFLEGLKSMVGMMIVDRVATIDVITRPELPIEDVAAGTPAATPGATKPPPRPTAGAGGAKAGPAPLLAEDTVVKRYPFSIRFSGTNRSVQEVLNHLASAPDFFYAVRAIRVENEKKDGPVKSQTPIEGDEAKKKDSQVVLGGEKVAVWMAIDLLRFLEPAPAAEPKTPGKQSS